jgi:hypothetical protein
VPSLRVGRQAEQLARAVVRQGQPVVAVDQQQPLPYGVQDRVVVLVHAAQLGRRQPVRLAAQAGADQVRARGSRPQAQQARQDRRGDLPAHLSADLLDGDARADQRPYPSGGVPDGRHGPYGGAERAGVGLGERAPGQGGGGRAQEASADLPGVGMGVPDALPAHDRDEVQPRLPAHPLGVRLERRGGIGIVQGVEHGGRTGHADRHGRGRPGRLVVQQLPDVKEGEKGAARRGDPDDDDLEHEHLPGQAPSSESGGHRGHGIHLRSWGACSLLGVP